MPKFLVTMNIVESKGTSFILEAESESDVHDALGELDYTFFEKNCDWTTTDYEPPVVDNVQIVKPAQKIGFTKEGKNKKIQKRFDKIVDSFNKVEKNK